MAKELGEGLQATAKGSKNLVGGRRLHILAGANCIWKRSYFEGNLRENEVQTTFATDCNLKALTLCLLQNEIQEINMTSTHTKRKKPLLKVKIK